MYSTVKGLMLQLSGTSWLLDGNRRDLVHTNPEPMALNSASILILKHRHGLVTDCH